MQRADKRGEPCPIHAEWQVARKPVRYVHGPAGKAEQHWAENNANKTA